jgi:hypothetical protein
MIMERPLLIIYLQTVLAAVFCFLSEVQDGFWLWRRLQFVTHLFRVICMLKVHIGPLDSKTPEKHRKRISRSNSKNLKFQLLNITA